MRIKTALCLCSQPVRLSCQASALFDIKDRIYTDKLSKNESITNELLMNRGQKGASSLLLALFVVVILVTAIVSLMFGHKLGYQRGYHVMKTQINQDTINNGEATVELKDLRLNNKILTNQVATAKQELEISLTTLNELRESQQEMSVENRQVTQLNEIYAEVISEKGGMPLQILGAKIEPLPENAFEYGFDIGMLSSSGKGKSVNATLTLLNEEELVEVPLEPSRYSVKGIERIRGRFVMPAGFKPLQIKLKLESSGQKVEQLYDWKLGATVDDMPLSLMDLPEFDESPITTE